MAEASLKIYSEVSQNFVFPEWKSQDSEIYINPRFEEARKSKILKALARVPVSPSSIVLCSSASTGSPKVFQFSKQAFLNSAERVSRRFSLGSKDRWLSPLPLFHVGALGISARAFVSQASAEVFDYTQWSAEKYFEHLNQSAITHSSLVPTQLFDLLEQGFRGPIGFRVLFLGGEQLDHDLYRRAAAMGWPVVPTYGMTESASMIASSDNIDATKNLFLMKLFEGVRLQENSTGIFELHCDSLFDAQLEYEGDSAELPRWNFRSPNRGIPLSDLIERKSDEHFFVIGRRDGFTKVRGEFVKLDVFEESLAHALKVPVSKIRIVLEQDSRPVLLLDTSLRSHPEALVERLESLCALPPFLKFKELRFFDFEKQKLGQWKRNL